MYTSYVSCHRRLFLCLQFGKCTVLVLVSPQRDSRPICFVAMSCMYTRMAAMLHPQIVEHNCFHCVSLTCKLIPSNIISPRPPPLDSYLLQQTPPRSTYIHRVQPPGMVWQL